MTDVTPRIEQALATDRVIDIPTTGRTTGVPRRIDLPAHATPVEGEEKERVLQAIVASVTSSRLTLDPQTSPLVEVTWTD